MSTSSLRTTAARMVSGSGIAAISSPDAPSRIALRMASIDTVGAFRGWASGEAEGPGVIRRYQGSHPAQKAC